MIFLIAPITYALYGLIAIPLILLGWILVPIAAAFKAYEAYFGHDGAGNARIQFRFTWPFMFPWDNAEDGIADETYWKSDNMFLQIVYWSCVRNPVNNLRITPIISCKLNPKRIQFIGSFGDISGNKNNIKKNDIWKYDSDLETFWYFCWQGLYSNIRFQFNVGQTRWRVWMGWKIYPHDIYGIKETDYRFKGAGFATQIKKISKNK